MKNEKWDRNNTLSIKEKREVKEQWGDLSKRRFFCVDMFEFQTNYYIELPHSVAESGSRNICNYITDFYGAMNLEGIRRVVEVKMIGCMVNWHANILVDTSYINSDSNNVFVMTLAEQKRMKANKQNREKLSDRLKQVEVA